MNYIDILHNLLEYFNKNRIYLSIRDIKKDFKDFEFQTEQELLSFVLKLCKDEFVTHEMIPLRDTTTNVVTPSHKFHISVEGMEQANNGGYSKFYASKKQSQKAKNQKENLLIWGTWLAGIGSLSYVVWEIGLRFCWW